jgi:uncharacterized protein with NRDE domain
MPAEIRVRRWICCAMLDRRRQHELPSTGVSAEWESLLSSAFIKAPQYGTRCSTIVRFDAETHCFLR